MLVINNISLVNHIGENLCSIDLHDSRINIETNHLSKSVLIDVRCDLSNNKVQEAQYLQIEFDPINETVTHFMSNGFQTWTESRWYDINESIKNLSWYTKPIWSFFNMKSYGDYSGIQYQNNGLHSFHFSCLKMTHEYSFIGSLNENNGHSIFIYNKGTQKLKLLKEVTQEQNSTSVNLYLSANHNAAEIFKNYFDYQNLETDNSSVSGWTSWYNYYTKINEDIIVENLNNFIDNKIPIDIFQIDDGWQEAVGDWNVNEKFPGGLQAIVNHAHQHKIKMGLWLAPFVAERKSKLCVNHPDWIRRDTDGQKVKAGYSLDWSGDFYVLEWRLPIVKEYIKTYLDVILNKWGFDMLKLDFLYAVCLGLDQKSKGQEMSEAMDWLNQVIGEKNILACGVPLASSFGKVSYCRVSSDVALKWEDGFLSNHVRYRERVSTLNALRSTVNRSLLNNRAFINDPDVYILRTENNQLTENQKESLYLINQSLGGLLFTSDNIGKYGKEQWRQYLMQFPIREKSIIDLNNLEDSGWVILKNRELIYMLTYNLSPSSQSIEIPDGDWYNSDGLTNSLIKLSSFQSKIYLKSSSSDCQLIYSDGHLFPGMEIDQLNVSDNNIYITLNESSRLTTINYIFEVNNAFDNYYFNDQMIKPEIWQGRRVVKYKHTL